MDDLSRFCCQDPDCPDYGKRGHGNLTVIGHYGKTRPHRLLYCRTCKARFSERKGTPLFRSCLPEDKALSVIEHLADRNGVRATARQVGVTPQHGGPLQPTPGRARPATPRRARGFFPLGPGRSSSTRSGRSSPRSRSTATRLTRPMPSGAIGGITRPTIPSTSWSCAWSPGRGRPRMPRPWWPTSRNGRRAAP